MAALRHKAQRCVDNYRQFPWERALTASPSAETQRVSTPVVSCESTETWSDGPVSDTARHTAFRT
jgi:hypothetical protein